MEYKQYEKTNSRLIGAIKKRINLVQRTNRPEQDKPTCMFTGSKHIIVGYSYSVGDHKYLKFSLKPVNQQMYFTVYAYHISPETITINQLKG